MKSRLNIRNTGLDDTRAISQLFRRPIPRWQRLDGDGRVQDLDYDQLTLYERWLHGGPWMSIETGAIWLNHLMHRGVITLIAEHKQQIIAYLEAYIGQEPRPYGRHVHIGQLIAEGDYAEEARHALVQHLIDWAEDDQEIERVTVAVSGHDAEAREFYTTFTMQPLTTIGKFSIPAQTGQGFYKITEQTDDSPEQIHGWHLLSGHMESSLQQWEARWPFIWSTIPEISAQRIHRLHITASGQTALMLCQQQLYDPRSADIFCWSPQPLKSQLITAISDWAHRENYRNLIFALPTDMIKPLGTQVETYPYKQQILAVEINPS